MASESPPIRIPLSQQAPNVLASECPSRQILNHVTSRWGVLVFVALRGQQTRRFSELRRAIGGVSERMLAQTLQTLEADGFVHRHAYDVVPPHVEYTLTPLGEEAATHVVGLASWIEANLHRLQQGRDDDDSEGVRP